MNRLLRVQQLAERDILEAYEWYEGQRPELGDELLKSIDECFSRIVENPLGYQLVHRKVRRALTRRFPYCVYFVVTDTEVIVLAVLHGRGNPLRWRGRV